MNANVAMRSQWMSVWFLAGLTLLGLVRDLPFILGTGVSILMALARLAAPSRRRHVILPFISLAVAVLALSLAWGDALQARRSELAVRSLVVLAVLLLNAPDRLRAAGLVLSHWMLLPVIGYSIWRAETALAAVVSGAAQMQWFAVALRKATPGELPLLTGARFGRLVRLAVPVGLVVTGAFALFPRYLPRWNPAQGGGTRGVTSAASDLLAPGQIAQLAMSQEVAFRVRFAEGERPPGSELYWRMTTFDAGGGLEWARGVESAGAPQAEPEFFPGANTGLDYELWLVETGVSALPALEHTTRMSVRGLGGLKDAVRADGHVFRMPGNAKVRTGTRVSGTRPETVAHRSVDDADLAKWRKLPDHIKQSRALSELLARLAPVGPANARRWLRALDDHFISNGFSYTLTPKPMTGPLALEEFLLRSRAGFCEHYAAAAVTLLRLAGVPARIVGGYYGAEWNDRGGFATVRQSHAHAWVEAFDLQSRSWVRHDPTLAVAPARALTTLVQGFGELRFGIFSGLWRDARDWLDAARYFLDAGGMAAVSEFISDLGAFLLDDDGAVSSLALVAVLLALVIGMVAVRAWRASEPESRLQRNHADLVRALARSGVATHASMGPFDLADAVARAVPNADAAMRAYVDLYAALRYGEAGVDREKVRRLVSLSTQVRRSLNSRVPPQNVTPKVTPAS